jgi:hypothetical protein
LWIVLEFNDVQVAIRTAHEVRLCSPAHPADVLQASDGHLDYPSQANFSWFTETDRSEQ